MQPARRERGRGVSPGLAVLALVAVTAACADDGPPAVELVPDALEPDISEGDRGARVVENHGASERFLVRRELETAEPPLTLLFLGGRAATPLPDGAAAWPDVDGDRVVRFDDRGRVEEVLQGGPGAEDRAAADEAAEPPLSEPVAVIPAAEGLQVEERSGRSLLFPDEDLPERLRPSALPLMGGGEGVRFLGQTVLSFTLAPIPEGDPLLWRVEDEAGRTPVGEPVDPPSPPLGRLVNSGWAAPAPGGGTYFASALRPEVLRFDGDGEVIWQARWDPPREIHPPELETGDGALQPVFSTLQHGMVPGPDGHVHVLASSRQAGRADHLLAFDDDGILVREAEVSPEAAIFADAAGRVYELPAAEALGRSPRDDRRAFQPFELPALGQDHRVRLADYEGQVVLVNFWASWCPPCRREIPLLDEMARDLAEDGLVVVGLNEDEGAGAALEFLEELGGVSYPNAAGRGDLRRRYDYRGLPYTVILDREQRVAHEVYGFGTSIEPLREAVEEVLAEEPR